MIPKQDPLRAEITQAYRMDETQCVQDLLSTLSFTPEIETQIAQLAREFIEKERAEEAELGGMEALMRHYDLSTEEGILLMCLAEALLRVPDKQTENDLIRDKLSSANWINHLQTSESTFVNLATRGLAFTGKVLNTKEHTGLKSVWYGLLRRSGEPLIRKVVRDMVKVMSEQFVLGRSIEEAIQHSGEKNTKGYIYSYDMLGEVARTQEDGQKYFQAYQHAIDVLGKNKIKNDLILGPSISVKLSALYPRYEFAQRETAIPALTARLLELAKKAKAEGISLTMDAEEADRLDLSLTIFKTVFEDSALQNWEGLGLAVQAYQKRAYPVLKWLIDLARQNNKCIQMRLVKGAYWDSEIKLSQVGGFSDYPVFTRKTSTDVNYLACAQFVLSAQDAIYPQFATHNAYTVAAILVMMDDIKKYQFEFQNLQGMGKSLHDQLVNDDRYCIPCRIYAPVGKHEELLPYLVRRLLENGANTSFVNKVSQQKVSLAELITSPVEYTHELKHVPHPKIPLPQKIYGEKRLNAKGIDLSHITELEKLTKEIATALQQHWKATPFHRKLKKSDSYKPVFSPSNRAREIGRLVQADKEAVTIAFDRAQQAFISWQQMDLEKRCAIMLKAGDILEEHTADLMALIISEGGRTIVDALSEVREAVDYCRYYSVIARETLAPHALPGPTGETNELHMRGRGVIVCISPWNFPAAIFTGQVVAALVAGNTVIAKPAQQTPLIAAKVIELLYEAGVPKEAVQLLPGRGSVIGDALIDDPRVAGVLFTGSTETARGINQRLANKSGPLIPFVAETGGINAMIVDSTALPEQLVIDVMSSAFSSAGQRCSALRLLCLQEDIADTMIHMLKGAMAQMKVGDPMLLSTDVGPVIDHNAQTMLQEYTKKIKTNVKLIYQMTMPPFCKGGSFFPPCVYELPDVSFLDHEVFGPVLHIVRYKQKELDVLIDQINSLGYGLTFGIQSRIDETIHHIQNRIQAGNIYVNRNMIGAVVGVQPFGGQRLSGTGPKAGGPHYLTRLCDEVTITVNTTASGGNATLLMLSK